MKTSSKAGNMLGFTFYCCWALVIGSIVPANGRLAPAFDLGNHCSLPYLTSSRNLVPSFFFSLDCCHGVQTSAVLCIASTSLFTSSGLSFLFFSLKYFARPDTFSTCSIQFLKFCSVHSSFSWQLISASLSDCLIRFQRKFTFLGSHWSFAASPRVNLISHKLNFHFLTFSSILVELQVKYSSVWQVKLASGTRHCGRPANRKRCSSTCPTDRWRLSSVYSAAPSLAFPPTLPSYLTGELASAT